MQIEDNKPLPDGVFIGLDMQRYVRDRALSGSGFAKLNLNAPDWQFEHEDNLLWKRAESPYRNTGTLLHVPLFEGMAAYESRYCIAPKREEHADAIETATDAARWIEKRNAALSAPGFAGLTAHQAAPYFHKNGNFKGIAKSGSKEELFARIGDHCQDCGIAAPTFWEDVLFDHAKGREIISEDDDAAVRLAFAVLDGHPVYSKLITGGLPEVTIVYTDDDGVRFKCRLDYLKAHAIVDGKSFGRVSPRGLLKGFLADMIAHGCDMQAVHQVECVEQAVARDLPIVVCEPGEPSRFYEDKTIAKEVRALLEGPKRFVWLGVRVNGGAAALAVAFDNDTLVFGAAQQKVAAAVETFKKYRDAFGGIDTPWIRSLGLVEPDISEWPMYATEVPNHD